MKDLVMLCLIVGGYMAYVDVYMPMKMEQPLKDIAANIEKYYSGQGTLPAKQNVGKFQKLSEAKEVQDRLPPFADYDSYFPVYNATTSADTFMIWGKAEEIPAGAEMELRSYHNPEAISVLGNRDTDYKRLCYSGSKEQCFSVVTNNANLRETNSTGFRPKSLL